MCNEHANEQGGSKQKSQRFKDSKFNLQSIQNKQDYDRYILHCIINKNKQDYDKYI